jgi:PAS domain S-box-containing protein
MDPPSHARSIRGPAVGAGEGQAEVAAEARTAIGSIASVFEGRPGAVILVDQSGQICIANAAAERMFGYGQGELVGRPVEVLVPDRYRGSHPGQRARFAASGKLRPMGTDLGLLAVRQDGVEFPVDISIGPLEIAEGTFTLATVLNRPTSSPIGPGGISR